MLELTQVVNERKTVRIRKRARTVYAIPLYFRMLEVTDVNEGKTVRIIERARTVYALPPWYISKLLTK